MSNSEHLRVFDNDLWTVKRLGSMGNLTMKSQKLNSRGFTLIASLLLLLLMSAMSVGLFMMVNTEGKAGGHDLQNTIAFRSAEGGMEKMTADLANEFQSIQNPSVAQIVALSSLNPNPSTYVQYTLTPATVNNDGVTPLTHWTQIPSGVFQGLNAQTLDVTLNSTAQTPLNDQVSMTRTVQIAMVPVFQFGAFSETDLSYTNNPTFDFLGRVHTNGDLYLNAAGGNTVTFHDKVEAYGNIIREVWPNGINAAGIGATGTVKIPTASRGCDAPVTGCLAMDPTWESVVGYPNWTQNASPMWKTNSVTKYPNATFIDGDNGNSTYGTGAQNLNLPFISGSDITAGNTAGLQHQMIQRPPAGESTTGALGSSRLYNQAQIRILLSDDPTEFLSDSTNTDGQTVRLANVNNNGAGPDYRYGIPGVSVPSTMPVLSGSHAYSMYFATASTGIPDPSTCGASSCNNLNTGGVWGPPADWNYEPANPPTASLLTLLPNSGAVTNASVNAPLNNVGTNLNGPTTAAPLISSVSPPPGCSSTTGVCTYPYYSLPIFPKQYYTPYPNDINSTWNLIDGYLRVEAFENGAWVGVTQEWLKLGFARGTQPPTSTPPNAGSNPVNPNAILLLQEPADRNADGAVNAAGVPPTCTRSGSVYTCSTSGVPPEVAYDQITSCTPAVNCAFYGDNINATAGTAPLVPGKPSVTMFNWYPINFYDSREGEAWDVRNTATTTCSANGVMNAVELDVGNLKRWLTGATGTTGTQISSATANGYLVYFSDRRGMLPFPIAPSSTSVCVQGAKCGGYGFEDTINLSNSGVPNGTPEPPPPGKALSPEDVDQDGVLQTYGGKNIGLGFGIYSGTTTVNGQINKTATVNPYARFSCSNMARQNWVSGARHVLKLVDGGWIGTTSQLPLPGFTVGSENPVYVLGPYNTYNADTEWTSPLGTDTGTHSNAAVIADAVTLLSSNWSDYGSFTTPQTSFGQTATTSAYRLAVAGGKPMNFQNLGASPAANFGTDGGVGNFLRFLEDWCSNGSPCATQQTLHYAGSIVSLYYSEYATGTFKCCDIVYNPPIRDYKFDQDFSVPSGLPPGTPMFRDIDNLNYRQLLTQRGNAD
jgi:Tfp pilus assembly protein PilX